MKKTIISFILIAVFMSVVLFSGCVSTPSGDVITEEKDFADFTHIDVGGAFEIEITQSDSFSVIISADESLFDLIEVSKVGGELKIYLNPRHIFTDFTVGAKSLKAEITMPALYKLSLSGVTKGTITGFESIHDFSLVISGASSLEASNIKVGGAQFEVSGDSRVSGNMTAKDVTFEVSGTSSIELLGSADNVILKISGASKTDLSDFMLTDAVVEISGASEVTLNASGRVDAALSGASNLYFYGNPIMGSTDVSGASTIKHK
ncbi:head GIN domain-containing protein [Chloroflexota bacterium]